MALGFLPNFLQRMSVVADPNYSGKKISQHGLVKALVENNPSLQITKGSGGETINPLKLNTLAGNIREVVLKYLPRIVDSQVEELDDCDNNQIFHYKETSVTTPRFAKFSFFLDWQFLEKYEADAATQMSLGTPAYGAVKELEEQLMHAANALVSKMDKQLLADITWGKNKTTGLTTAKTININDDSTVFNVDEGFSELLYDVAENEFYGTPIIVGSGLMSKFMIAKNQGALGLAQNGQNLSAYSGFQYYHDTNAATAWAANQVGVFAPGTIGLVDIDRYIAWKTGSFGTSHFATIMLPVESGVGAPQMMTFNIQIKEIYCPTEVYNCYGTTTSDRGYQVILTKRYGIFQIPTDTYQTTAVLTGVNGALRFAITND